MTGREKLKKALNHQDGPIPVDFGSSAVTGIHASVVAELREYYGLEKKPVKIHEPFQMLGFVDADLREAIGIDVEGVFAPGTFFGFRNENWKEWRTPWGQDVLVPGGFEVIKDGEDTLIYPEGDREAPPSGRMPSNGYFFDAIIRQEPIVEENLDPKDNLEEFGPISEDDLKYYSDLKRSIDQSSSGFIANFGNTGLGDIACVPAPFMKYPKGIRDVTEWYISTVSRRDYIHTVFAEQMDIAIKNLAKIHGIFGDSIDVIFTCGTDFGTQSSTFCSIDTFNDLYFPYYKQLNEWIHENTSWKIFKHSCGSVVSFMQRFIDAGFDIMNPVQLSAAGMDASMLKNKYGDKVVFWGGCVDTQKTLPFGTPEEVKKEVLTRCEIFSQKGGFVLNSIHNVQAKTPVKNFAAMIEAVKEFNGDK